LVDHVPPKLVDWVRFLTGSYRRLEKRYLQPVYCCDRKARAASAQSFTLWQQATIEITPRDHSVIVCSRHVYRGVVLRAHPVRGESHIQRNASGEVATTGVDRWMQGNSSLAVLPLTCHYGCALWNI